MSKINETNYPRRTQANYADTDMLVIQAAGGNTYTTRLKDMREDYEATLAPTLSALQDDINENLATIEAGSTASKVYAKGDYLVFGGKLCRVTSTSIAAGATLTIGTNIELAPVGDELKTLSSDLTSKANKDTSNFENQHAWLFGASGNLVKNYYNIVQIGKYLLVSITFTTKTGLDSGSTLIGAIYYKDNNNNYVYPALTARHYAVLSCFQGDNNNVVTIAQTAGTLIASNALTSNTWYQMDVILKLS